MSDDEYLFTGTTCVRTKWRGNPDTTRVGPEADVAVLATDQANAERIATAILSTPSDGGDMHQRLFKWTRVEHARAVGRDAR